MTFPTFLDSLIARNMTALLGKPGVGGCYGRVTAEASGATALKKLSVYSDQGEVQVAEPPRPAPLLALASRAYSYGSADCASPHR